MSQPAAPLDPSGYADPGRPSFCARCGGPVEERERDTRVRPICPKCGWVYYARQGFGAAVAIESDEGLLLIQRSHDPYKGDWMLPAGFVEYGEFAEETAVREAAEETGLQVELLGLAGLYYGTDDPRNPSHLALYVARVTGGDLQPADDAIDARFFTRDAPPSNVAFHAHRQALAHWRTRGFGKLAPLTGRTIP